MIPFQILGMAVGIALLGMLAVHLIARRGKRKRAEALRWVAFSIQDAAYTIEGEFKSTSLPYSVGVCARDHRGALIVIHAEGEPVCPMRVRARAIDIMRSNGWDEGDLEGHWEIVVFGGMPAERPPAGNRWGGFTFSLSGKGER